MINLYTELDEISFIAGTREVLQFDIYDKNGKAVELDTMKNIKWMLSYIGDKDTPVLIKDGEVFDTNHFRVLLESSDTINLNGKFIHQPVLEDILGNIYKPAEGLINIVESIKE